MDKAAIVSFLAERGVKSTVNRILVMDALSAASCPVSLADIEELLDFSVDKASIFRVLELFADKDVVHLIEDGSRSLKYELCQNPSHHSIDDEHVHFHCERCGATFCLESVRVPKISLPDGFSARSVNYMVKGVCPKCKS